MRVDLFAHGMAPELRAVVVESRSSNGDDLANWRSLTTLFDMGAREEILDACKIDLQVLTTPSPPLETLFEGDELRIMSRLANDSMADLVDHGNDRYRGTVSVPLCDPAFAVSEVRRGVEELGLVGPQIFTSSNGQPLDSPELQPFWSELERLEVPAWLHPERSPDVADYPIEDRSLYGIFLVLGWPYETSVAMSRLVLSGVMDRHPNLDIIVHHAGAMIPFFAQRIDRHYPVGESLGRMDNPPLERSVLDGFRRFYVDTVVQGSVAALMCAYDFFGRDRFVLGTDTPFGPSQGLEYCELACDSVEAMPITESERSLVRSDNGLRLLGMG